jgi:hypothetical protein
MFIAFGIERSSLMRRSDLKIGGSMKKFTMEDSQASEMPHGAVRRPTVSARRL